MSEPPVSALLDLANLAAILKDAPPEEESFWCAVGNCLLDHIESQLPKLSPGAAPCRGAPSPLRRGRPPHP